MANILEAMDLEEEHRKKTRAEEALATKAHFQNIRQQANDITNGILGMWDKISDQSFGVAKVRCT
jgi:hypothetical protein